MISKSPYGDNFEYVIDLASENAKIDKFVNSQNRKTVVVQGLGFVGSAMVAALAGAKDKKGRLLFNVIGVDCPDEKNYWKIARLCAGKPPVLSSDKNMDITYKNAHKNKNLLATYSAYAYAKAKVVVVDIHLDALKKKLGKPYKYNFSYKNFKKAIRTVADNVSLGTLVIIETTVPPGTTEKVVWPIFKDAFKKRKIDINRLYLGHSYERVMPGPKYLDSIINFHRVYSGINRASKLRTEEFLKSFINTRDYPLFAMHSTTASEMAKVLENSFRAMNIAFIQEWTEYARNSKVNLFEVVEAIRVRPTHKNIMSPGFGVGGYCLPKDSLFADWSSRNLFGAKKHLEMSLRAIAVNDLMPDYTFSLLKAEVPELKNKRITILGISYLPDISDTRYSPAGYFYDKCLKEKARINLHDPLVNFWQEKNIKIYTDIKQLRNKRHDIVVFASRHREYLNLKAEEILSLLPGVKIIIDANSVISEDNAKKLFGHKVKMIGVGKGHWEDSLKIK